MTVRFIGRLLFTRQHDTLRIAHLEPGQSFVRRKRFRR
jgi:hypothetical protein